MSDKIEDNLQVNEINIKELSSNDINTVKIIYKRPEYLNIAKRRYYAAHKDEPEFKEKYRLYLQKYREEHRERVNELARIRRRKKKDELNAAANSKDKNLANNDETNAKLTEKLLNVLVIKE